MKGSSSKKTTVANGEEKKPHRCLRMSASNAPPPVSRKTPKRAPARPVIKKKAPAASRPVAKTKAPAPAPPPPPAPAPAPPPRPVVKTKALRIRASNHFVDSEDDEVNSEDNE